MWCTMHSFLALCLLVQLVTADYDDTADANITVCQVQDDQVWMEKDSKGKLVGFIPDLFAALAPLTGLTYHLVAFPNFQWGLPQPGGTFDGVIGSLLNGSCDVGGEFLITDVRRTVLDFLPPLTTVQTRILINSADADRVDQLQPVVLAHTPELDPTIFQKLRSSAHSQVQSEAEALSMVTKGGFAYLTPSNPATEKAVAASNGHLQFLPEVVSTSNTATGFRKGSALLQPFAAALATLRASGELNKLLTKNGLLP